MRILAIDPGPEKSAWVVWDGKKTRGFGKNSNEKLIKAIRKNAFPQCRKMYVEMIASYGMAVGKEVFETCLWIGRYLEAWQLRPSELVYRKDVKLEICGSMKAKDSNVRQALIDLVGPRGTKKAPGPTYGITKDVWAALGVAIVGFGRINGGASR